MATELGLALASRGHEIHFITYKQPVRLALLNQHVYFHEVHVPNYALFHYQPYELALSSKLVDMVKLHGIETVTCTLCNTCMRMPGIWQRKCLKKKGFIFPWLPPYTVLI